MKTGLASFLLCLALLAPLISQAQTLALPPRPVNAPGGGEFFGSISNLPPKEREELTLAQVVQGNIPGWMRNLVPITIGKSINGTNHTLTYFALADYLAVGSDTDYFQMPMTPLLAQRIANLTRCTLPTRLMVNQIWSNSAVKMTANTFSPKDYVIHSPAVFALENEANRAQRFALTNVHPLGALVSGDKKDIILSTLIYGKLHKGVPKPVVIYGWIQPNGAPIQPAYNGHAETYMDYSHGTRLVQMAVRLDGAPASVNQILSDDTLWPLLEDEGAPMKEPFYKTADEPSGRPPTLNH